MLTHTWTWTLRAIFPTDCMSCHRRLTGDPVPFFCRTCWDLIRPLSGPACPRCDRPFASPVASLYSPTHLCSTCRKQPPAFTKAWTLYPYGPPLREALTLLKYGRKYGMGSSLCRLLTDALPPLSDMDQILPVPLHPARLRTREYNQSLLLAEAVSRRVGTALSYTNLVRIVDTPAQTTLPRSSRLSNLRHTFHVRRPEAVRGRRVLVVDDVFTTGTTVNECARTLRKAGALDVYVLTLARTVDQGFLPDQQMPIVSGSHPQDCH